MKIKSEGKTEFERFNNAVGKIMSVSSAEMKRRLAADPRGHEKARKAKAAKAKVKK